MALDLAYRDEQEIIAEARHLDDSEICFYPAESELGHRALASLRGETLVQRERPDFEDLTQRLLLEVMIVDDHPRPGKKDATRARETAILRELREAGFEQMAPNASLLAAVDSGLPTEQDHNYRAYVDHFATVVVKHSHKISAYRAQRPGFDLGFLVFDESTAYFESLGAFGRHSRGRAHVHFADQVFLNVIRDAGVDYVMWLTPYKVLNTDIGRHILPRLTILDVSLLDGSSHESYDAKRMKSSEK